MDSDDEYLNDINAQKSLSPYIGMNYCDKIKKEIENKFPPNIVHVVCYSGQLRIEEVDCLNQITCYVYKNDNVIKYICFG